jgi:hypothetical protein
MYTGTCVLYDANNQEADGNSGWSCYDRVGFTTLSSMDDDLDELDALNYEEDLFVF